MFDRILNVVLVLCVIVFAVTLACRSRFQQEPPKSDLSTQQIEVQILHAMVNDALASAHAKDALVSGCVAAALRDQNMAPAIIASNGAVCVSAMAVLIGRMSLGLNQCPLANEKCFFSQGFITVLVQAGAAPQNQTDLDRLDKVINASYNDYRSKENQE